MVIPDSSLGLDQAFRRSVARGPDREAVITDARTATAAEIAERVESLARRLRDDAGYAVIIAPNDAVDLVVGVLAAARVGASAVLADPRRPPEVLRGLATRVAATSVVRGSERETLVPPDTHDRPRGTAAIRRGSLREAAVWVPTSGTTTEPRLVGMTEAGLLGMATQAVNLGILRPDDRVARLATHIGIGPLLSAVLLGIPYLALDVRTRPPSLLVRWMEQQQITYLHLAPTLLRMVIAAGGAPGARTRPPSGEGLAMRLVGAGGEALRWEDVALVRAPFGGDVTVLHTYSSTEAGLVTALFVPPDGPVGTGILPAGLPVPGRKVWIDDGTGHPAAPEALGEVVVEGSLETFAVGMSITSAGERQLRTGDLGAIGADGTLSVHGRIAADTKIGLWRVDLRAVESAIMTVPGVVDVAVQIQAPGGTTARSLIAHVVLAEGSTVSDDELRTAVSALTQSAVPRRFVRHLAPFPVLPSGKVDALALKTAEEAVGPTAD
jgi:acyl-coenzyme A synthetase/AMP-(fatty) acid ligase